MILLGQQYAGEPNYVAGAICISVFVGMVAFVIWGIIYSARKSAKESPKPRRSLGATLTPMIAGGFGLCGVQVIWLVNAKPGANYGVLVGGLVGAAVGTLICVVVTVRSYRRSAVAESSQLPPEEK